ncbi:sodium:solute symporter family protein [Streptomyces sp. GS7]|uniref:sodium:solute symporter family protein n=1 Tax=Streptomyces sp. GS7 TaxID=2692234 RepID=UPI001F33ADB7|nr:sodium:solute symporter [Streptomyces sp. GS7]
MCGAVLVGVAGRPSRELPHPRGWALGGGRLGTLPTGFLMGGTVITAYTYVAVPGLMFGAGGLALYALTYLLLLTPLITLVLPRLHRVAARHGMVTAADYVRARHGSHALALAVALTGILATMPYLALQVIGMATLLDAMGLPAGTAAGCLGLALLFGLCAAATQPAGLRATARIAPVKALLTTTALAVTLVLAITRLGGPGAVFAAAGHRLSGEGLALVVPPQSAFAYATLALGTALAQPMYPQIVTVALAAGDRRRLHAATAALPLWAASLALTALLGVAALAAGVRARPGHAELAVPLLIRTLTPDWLTGLLFGALAVGALLPACVMSMSMATLLVRNIYTEYLNPTATPKHEVRIARTSSLCIMAGAVLFALVLHPQDAVNLHLLGGVWILQTLPAVAISLFTRWFHHRALIAGWAAGMAAGTALLCLHDFSSVVNLSLGPLHASVYAALTALALNLAVSAVLTPVLDRLGIPRNSDSTLSGPPLERRGSKYTVIVD